MNGFLEKTTQNLTAAKILLDQCHYSSSVHCLFYGCLQTALHVLFVKLKHDKTKFVNDMQQKKTGTHQQVSDLIADALKKNSEEDSKWFKKNFSALKTLRVKADYEAAPISQTEGYDALSKTNAINNLIKKISYDGKD